MALASVRLSGRSLLHCMRQERKFEHVFDEQIDKEPVDWQLVFQVSAALDRVRERMMKLVGYPKQPAWGRGSGIGPANARPTDLLMDSNPAPIEAEPGESHADTTPGNKTPSHVTKPKGGLEPSLEPDDEPSGGS